MELRLNSVGNFSSSSTWLAHSTQELEVLNVVGGNPLSIKPEFIVDPLSDKLKWWLRPKRILLRHIEIIDEAHSLMLGILGLVLVLCSSLEVTLNDVLSAVRRSSSGEVDGEFVGVLVKCPQDSFDQNGFTDTRMSTEQNLLVVFHESLNKVSVSNRVYSWHHDLGELLARWLA